MQGSDTPLQNCPLLCLIGLDPILVGGASTTTNNEIEYQFKSNAINMCRSTGIYWVRTDLFAWLNT